MTEDITLKELMEDLQLQTEVHDKETLKKRREYKKREKQHDAEVYAKRKRPRRVAESVEERKLRKYKKFEETMLSVLSVEGSLD